MWLRSVVNALALVAPIVASVRPDPETSHLLEQKRALPLQAVRQTKYPYNRDLRKRQSSSETIPVSIDLLVTTLWGESIRIVGSTSQLGNWDTSDAISLNAAKYTAGNPLWSTSVDITVGEKLTYKFIRILTDGTAEWEAGPDRTYTVPGNGATSAKISSSWQSGKSTTSASVVLPTRAVVTSSSAPAASCTNGPTARGCWSGRFSIDTDFDDDWPSTGKVVSYELTITNTTLAPDGFSRPVFAINGQYPGPTIYANWGDTVKITVNNKLEHNGTSLHWHGMRMWHANGQDGVPGVTVSSFTGG